MLTKRGFMFKKLFAIVSIIGLALFVYSEVLALKNAVDKFDKIDKIYGVNGTITYTNPNLNGGQWSYSRVGVVQFSPSFQYAEYGWLKRSTGTLEGLIAYLDPNGIMINEIINYPTAATHNYKVILAGGNHWFCYDNQCLTYRYTGFGVGDLAAAGGEVPLGVEEIGNTSFSGLQWFKLKSTGAFVWKNWSSHTIYIHDSPYYCTTGGVNYFNCLP